MIKVIYHNCGLEGHIVKDCRKLKVVHFGFGDKNMKMDCPNTQIACGILVGRSRLATGVPPPRGGNYGATSSGKSGERSYEKLNCSSVDKRITPIN